MERSWLDDLFAQASGAQEAIYKDGTLNSPTRGKLNFIGPGISIVDNVSTGAKDLTVVGNVSSITGTAPIVSSGGTTPAISLALHSEGSLATAVEGGVAKLKVGQLATDIEHGALGTRWIDEGGTHYLHGPAEPSGSSGFMSGPDKQKLDDITSTTPNTFTSGTPTLVAGFGNAAINVVSGTVTTANLPNASTVVGQSIRLKLDNLPTNLKVVAVAGQIIDGLGVVQIQGPRGEVTLFAESATKWVAKPKIPILTGKAVLLYAGDSITAGQSLDPGQTWPVASSSRVRGGDCYQFNKAVSGRKIADIVSGYATEVRANLSASRPNILSVLIGTNDLNAAGTGAAMYTALCSYLDTARADGLYIVVWTVPKSTVLIGSEETERQAYNAAILNATTGLIATGRADRVIDLASFQEFADPTNTTMLLDGTHPTAYVTQIMGAAYAAVVNDMLGYVEPSPITVTSALKYFKDVAFEIRADQVTLSVSDVSQASDVSGNANHYVSADQLSGTGHKPAWVSDVGDGLPEIDFDGTNSEGLIRSDAPLPSAGPFYLLMLVKPKSTGSNGRMWAQSNAAASHLEAFFCDTSTPAFGSFEYTPDAGAGWLVGDPDDPAVRASMKLTTTDYHIVELIHDGVRLRERVDGFECSNNIVNFNTVTVAYSSFGGIWIGPGNTMFTPKSMGLRHAIGCRAVPPWNVRNDLVNYVRNQWLPRLAKLTADLTATIDGAFHDLLTLTVSPDGATRAEIELRVSGRAAAQDAIFQLMVDGTSTGDGALIQAGTGGGALCKTIVPLTAGAHTIKAQYKMTAGGTLNLRPATHVEESASLSVRLV